MDRSTDVFVALAILLAGCLAVCCSLFVLSAVVRVILHSARQRQQETLRSPIFNCRLPIR